MIPTSSIDLEPLFDEMISVSEDDSLSAELDLLRNGYDFKNLSHHDETMILLQIHTIISNHIFIKGTLNIPLSDTWKFKVLHAYTKSNGKSIQHLMMLYGIPD